MEADRAAELLRAERERIEHALADLQPGGLADEDSGAGELADAASGLYDEEYAAGRAEKLRAELEAVERAEQRLAAGTYGISIESGEPIPDERLEAIPTAERTAAEQDRFERGIR
jgi:DnaK suppressor protein